MDNLEAVKNVTLEYDEQLQTKPREQRKFKLTISADEIVSTDERFTMDDLELGNNYKPLDIYFVKATGDEVRRIYSKGERRISNQTMPRLAFQIFEKEIAAMSVENKENFPVCRYHLNSNLICGIYSDVNEFKKHRNTLEYLKYVYDGGRQFVIYCWNIFSDILFVQECLKRFGKAGDKFILTYREKDEKETGQQNTNAPDAEKPMLSNGFLNPLSAALIEAKNIILRGAPGTGKTYLAREIAADIVSNGYYDDYTSLTDEQKEQVEFVQFHPSYDYTDFVEGLRPKLNGDGSMSFVLRDGIFKLFVDRARKNYEAHIKNTDELSDKFTETEQLKNYVFIIDEINRGEISKIFGELFFAIDPGYRGRAGEVSTQYSNLHKNPTEKFYIPENVYIIGTMNDIDRSVDTFDFAMRRRFRFIEIKPEDSLEMLSSLENEELEAEAIRRMTALNKAIADTDDLNENYRIGAAYFLKLKSIDFDGLWNDYLEPLLQEYVRGMCDEKNIIAKFKSAYSGKANLEGINNEADEVQG